MPASDGIAEHSSFLHWTAAAALIAALLTALGSHPAVSIGHWEKAEPITIGVFAAAALACVALALYSIKNCPGSGRVLSSPLVLTQVAIAAWGGLNVALAAYPMAVLLGPPQSAQGVLWYLACAAFVACALIARESRVIWTSVAAAAILVGLAVAILRFFPFIGQPQPLLLVGGYYAYIALALPMLAVPLAGKSRLVMGVAGLIVAILILAASLNASAAIAFAGGGVVTGALLLAARVPSRRFKSRSLAVSVVVLAAIVPYLVLQVPGILESHPSLLSRHLTMRIAEAAAGQTPSAVFLGHGLGYTQEALFRYAAASGERFWDSTWDFLSRDFYHSHNWMVEAYLTMGAGGTALTLIAYLAPVLWAEPALRPYATGFSSALVLLDGFWMPLAFFLPFLALAWAAVAARPARTKEPGAPTAKYSLRFPSAAFLLCLGALFLAIAAVQTTTAVRVSGIKAALTDLTQPAPTEPLPNPFHMPDQALAETVGQMLTFLAALPPQQREESARQRFAWMVEQLTERIPTTQTAVLAMAGMALFTATDVTKELAWLELPPLERDKLWAAWATRLLQLAPARADAVIPYFSHLLGQGRFDLIIGEASKILAVKALDPVGLYYLGIALTTDPSPARKSEGMRYIAAAISSGIEQFIPVPDWLRVEAMSYTLPGARR